MPAPTTTVTWTAPLAPGAGGTARLVVQAIVAGSHPRPITHTSGDTLAQYELSQVVEQGTQVSFVLPQMGPGWTDADGGAVPAWGWSATMIATSADGRSEAFDSRPVVPVLGTLTMSLDERADRAAAVAPAVQQVAAAAGVLAASADKRTTTSLYLPTAGDAAERPEGATWEVVDSTRTVMSRWVLRGGAWSVTALQGSTTIKESSTTTDRLSVGVGGNLMANPTMTDPAVWNQPGVSVLRGNIGYRGTPTVEVFADTANVRRLVVPINVAPDEVFTFTFAVRGQTTVSGQEGYTVYADYDNGKPLERLTYGLDGLVTTSWVAKGFQGFFGTPVDCGPRPKLVVEVPTTWNRWLQFSDISVRRAHNTALLHGGPILSAQVPPSEQLSGTGYDGTLGGVRLAGTGSILGESSAVTVVTPLGLKVWGAMRTASYGQVADPNTPAPTEKWVSAAVLRQLMGDTDWVPLVLEPGWSPAAGWTTDSICWRLKWGRLETRGRVNGTSAAGSGIARLPVNARPPGKARATNPSSAPDNGDVYVYGADAVGYARLAVYTRIASNVAGNIDGIIFAAGKSGAVGSLALSIGYWID